MIRLSKQTKRFELDTSENKERCENRGGGGGREKEDEARLIKLKTAKHDMLFPQFHTGSQACL